MAISRCTLREGASDAHHAQLRLCDGVRESGTFGLATDVSCDERRDELDASLANGETTVRDGIQDQAGGAVARSDAYLAYQRVGSATSASHGRPTMA